MREEYAKHLAGENLGLVHLCAQKFKDKGIDYDDLYSAGCLGLVKASKNFDPTRGFAFSTYAVPVILGEIKRCFRDGGEIRVSRAIKEKSRNLMKVKSQMEFELGRKVTVSELADKLCISCMEVAELINAGEPVLSLDYTGNDESVGMEIPDPSFENEVVDKVTVNDLLSALDSNDRSIIVMRYFEDLTQIEVAKKLGMTQVQVSRREKAILSMMRNKMCIKGKLN